MDEKPICAICLSVTNIPFVTEKGGCCGCVASRDVCLQCYLVYMSYSRRGCTRCMLCRVPHREDISRSLVAINRHFADKLDERFGPIPCPFGCSESVMRSCIVSHAEECVTAPCLRCDLRLVGFDHSDTCGKKIVQCPRCRCRISRKKLSDDHAKKCNAVVVECQWCHRSMTRGRMQNHACNLKRSVSKLKAENKRLWRDLIDMSNDVITLRDHIRRACNAIGNLHFIYRGDDLF